MSGGGYVVTPDYADVVIVRAGITGIAAAAALLSSGVRGVVVSDT